MESGCPKIVLAVTEVWQPQPPHSNNTPRTGHDLLPPQRGQRKPSGHRNRAKYARHASSVLILAFNSARFLGYSSTAAAYYILGLPESTGYPPYGIILMVSDEAFARVSPKPEEVHFQWAGFMGSTASPWMATFRVACYTRAIPELSSLAPRGFRDSYPATPFWALFGEPSGGRAETYTGLMSGAGALPGDGV